MNPFAKKTIAFGFLLFLALFLGGIVRSFTLKESDLPELDIAPPLSAPSREDYRSEARTVHNLAQIGFQTPLPQILDLENLNKVQVYEKTAHLTSGTTAFPEDEERTRKAIAHQQSAIFNERSTGIAPDRRLSLGIAVHPDRYDDLLRTLKQVGQLNSILVQQQDRTGEFRKLHAQRQSLKKYQEAILKLRGNEKLSVEEALKLEQKIQEIDKEVQAVGVQLGDLLGKEPSYNLFLQLEETREGGRRDRSFTLGRRLGSAFLWAAGWWFVTAVGIGLAAATIVSIRTLLSKAPPAAKTPPPIATADPSAGSSG